jgi:hypothetical protein
LKNIFEDKELIELLKAFKVVTKNKSIKEAEVEITFKYITYYDKVEYKISINDDLFDPDGVTFRYFSDLKQFLKQYIDRLMKNATNEEVKKFIKVYKR